MSKRFPVCLLVLILLGYGISYSRIDNSLLWKVTGRDGATSYVFGTIHIRDSLVLIQRDTVLSLLEQSRVFVAEIDLDSMMSMGTASAAQLLLPNGSTIESLYTPEELIIIRAALQKVAGPMAPMMEYMKPGALVALLSVQTAEATSTEGVDEFLWSYAQKASLPRRGIEYLYEQWDVISSMPKDVLVEIARNVDSMSIELTALRSAYLNENLDSLEQLGEEMNEYPEFSKSLNVDRNKVMVTRLLKDFKKGGIFLAIGALHLPGKSGVLALLAQKGFKVTPVLGGRRVDWQTRTR